MSGKALVCLWFDGGIAEAARFYCETFPDTRLLGSEAAPDGETILFEASAIIEHLAMHRLPGSGLIPLNAAAAVEARVMDRVFDNYVMNLMQEGVNEGIRTSGDPDPAVLGDVRARLERVYQWLENWLAGYERPALVTLIECAAAP